MRDTALQRAQEALLSRGLTAVADMGTTLADWQAMNRASRDGRLPLTIFSYADRSVALAASQPGPTTLAEQAMLLKVVGVKLYADGALGSRGAWLKAPYADAPGTRGLPLLTPDELRREAATVLKAGKQVAVHAIGDAANDMVLSAFADLGCSQGDRRCRVEHAQIIDVQDLRRFAAGKVVPSMQPVHQTSDRTMAEARLGPNRLGGAYAWQTLAKSGVRVPLGSDFPVEDPNPFRGLAAAITRQGMDDQPAGGWRPWERLSLGQALAGFTRDAAHASFAESRMGGLEPGQRADFILVDRDPVTATPHDLARTRVLETWIAGAKAWEAATVTPGERG
jgi:predicted amidohydrolase YtcJ